MSQTSGKAIVEGLDICMSSAEEPHIHVCSTNHRDTHSVLSAGMDVPLLALAVYNWTGYSQRHFASARSTKSSHPSALLIPPCIMGMDGSS